MPLRQYLKNMMPDIIQNLIKTWIKTRDWNCPLISKQTEQEIHILLKVKLFLLKYKKKSVESNHKQKMSYIRREKQLDWQFTIAKTGSKTKKSSKSSVQSLSHVPLIATPWTTACQASLSISNSQSQPKPMSIELMMPSNHLILCHPLLLLSAIFPSIRVFSNESTLRMRWPKYWSFNFNISPSNEHPGLISIRMDWLDLLAVQGTLKSLL